MNELKSLYNFSLTSTCKLIPTIYLFLTPKELREVEKTVLLILVATYVPGEMSECTSETSVTLLGPCVAREEQTEEQINDHQH